MPFLGLAWSFVSGGGLFTLLGKILDFLKSPAGIVLIVACAAFGGHLQGKWQAERVCLQEKRESIAAAKDIDLGAASAAGANMTELLRQAREQVLAAQAQLAEQKRETDALPQAIRDARRPTDDDWRRLH